MEKLVYLVWARPSIDRVALREEALGEVVPALLAVGVQRLEVHLDDDAADVAGPMPAPGTELPIRMAFSFWLGAYDRRGPAEAAIAPLGERCSGYLVTESLWGEYGDNGRRGPRDWAGGERSPGITTFSVLRRNPTLDPRTFRELWHGHQSPMSEAVQPRVRYVRNTVVHPLTPGAPPYDGIVHESWPSADLLGDLHAFHNGAEDRALGEENMRVMLDSVSQVFDLPQLRSEALSEYQFWE
jgi:hypothetical protein